MKKFKLLSRDDFRNSVFLRDTHLCVMCKSPAVDAHHIIERRLFSDGGYYLENGASVCQDCHIKAEMTTISCEELREKIGITSFPIPDHFYDEYEYTKWGDIILPNGNRLKGELFYDESVQKILLKGHVLNLYQKYVKYQRTYHVPWSTLGKDDRILLNDDDFKNKRVICTLKMDGENTTMYNDYIHARSIDSNSHPSRNAVKGIWSQISYLIDENMRICGENLYAKHTISYNDLPSYFMVFSIWINNTCLSWDETVDYSKILGLETVPVFYDDIYDATKIKDAFKKFENTNEGYVIRVADEFTYGEFRKSIAKFVRPSFKQELNNAHGHWISQKIESNKLNKQL